MGLKDWVILVMGLVLFWVVLRASYDLGAEDGYWEHEAEENAYGCEVMTWQPLTRSHKLT